MKGRYNDCAMNVYCSTPEYVRQPTYSTERGEAVLHLKLWVGCDIWQSGVDIARSAILLLTHCA